MKICTKCKQLRPDDEFNWRSKARGVRSTICKFCHKAYRDEHYRQNRRKRIEQAKVQQTKTRYKNKAKMLQLLEGQACKDCGESDPVVLEFDHLRDKIGNIGEMIHSGWSWGMIKKEIAKCELRCANCHRRKTARQRGFYKLRV